MIPEYFIYFTIVTSLTGAFVYIKETLRGNTKPNRVSWFLWGVIPLLGVFLAVKEGAGVSQIPVFMAGFIPLSIFAASFVNKNSYWNITKLDIWCGILSFASLIYWVVTRDSNASIFILLIADTLAAIPTMVKAWNFPETENPTPFITGLFNNSVGLLILKNWVFSAYAFGLYFILINIILISIIKRKEINSIFSRTYEQS